MTDKAVERAIRDGAYILCDTKKKTQEVTNMLLDLGFEHGGSGYSRKYSRGEIKDEFNGSSSIYSWYANPCIAGAAGIEYDARKAVDDGIPYDDFLSYYNGEMGRTKRGRVRCL